MCIGALAAVSTGIFLAFLDIFFTCGTLEAHWTVTLEGAARKRCACAPVSTRRRWAEILLLTVDACVTLSTGAFVLLQWLEDAAAAVVARRRITGILLRYLTQGRRETNGTPTRETRCAVLQHGCTGAPVLTPWSRPRVTRIIDFTEWPDVARRATVEKEGKKEEAWDTTREIMWIQWPGMKISISVLLNCTNNHFALYLTTECTIRWKFG